jgi:hypothetical protein
MESDTLHKIALRVEERFKNASASKFPYQDCYHLQKAYPALKKGLIPDLDCYFSFIAGYQLKRN